MNKSIFLIANILILSACQSELAPMPQVAVEVKAATEPMAIAQPKTAEVVIIDIPALVKSATPIAIKSAQPIQPTPQIQIIIDEPNLLWDKAIKSATSKWNFALNNNIFTFDKSKNKIHIIYKEQLTINNSAVGLYSNFGCNETITISFVKSYKRESTYESIALHELGHALGLKHTIYPSDIMYHSSNYKKELSENDIKMAKATKPYCI